MNELQRGNYAVRLPKMPSTELQQISRSFNQMAQAVADSADIRLAEARTRAELAENRALTDEIQSRIEQERGAIARELHDELGQQITAIKTLGLSIAQRSKGADPNTEQAARLVMSTADQIYDVIHHMIPRLRPLALDHFGLTDALDDLISDWRSQNPKIQFEWHNRLGDRVLAEKLATAAYRIVQEAVTNAMRHSNGERIRIELSAADNVLTIEITDDGVGLPRDWLKKGHFGVIGMQERAQALGGSVELLAAQSANPAGPAGRGLMVRARIPIEPQASTAVVSDAASTAKQA
jgi:two-component system sensor histidine kinase UhpB